MKNPKILAAAVAMALFLAACGSDDDSTDAGATDTDTETETETESTDDAMDDDAMDDESHDDDAMDDDAMEDEDAMSDDDAMEEDAMDDGEEGAMSEDGDEGGDDQPVAAPSQAGSLAIVSIDFSTAEIQLTNTTDAELDINGWVMCNFPSYAPIDGVDPIAPGETITVTSTVAIPPADGELAIYTAEDFTNAEAIVTYVEWGSDGHTRAPVASEAGIWDGTALTPDGDILTVAG